jgi:SAM-dependent methyltransferase
MKAPMAVERNPHGFLVGGRPEDLFKGTAAYYAAYRWPYPPAVVDYLARRCALDGHGRLLDAGCGTGQVFQVFAHLFDDVVAIDRDPEMVEYARKATSELGLRNVSVRELAVEDLGDDIAPLRMTIFGASFHWTDRQRVGDRIYDLTAPGGYLVVLAPNDVPRGTTAWEQVVRDVLVRQLGPERRAGTGVYCQGERHHQALARTRFKKIEQTDIPVVEHWSIDQIIGHLYSTSYASKMVVGDRANDLEQDLRQSLARIASDKPFEKTNEITAIIAER